MGKPSQIANWATDDTNNAEPTAPEKASGWETDAAPPASYFNWWQNLVGLWTDYANNIQPVTSCAYIFTDGSSGIERDSEYGVGSPSLPGGGQIRIDLEDIDGDPLGDFNYVVTANADFAGTDPLYFLIERHDSYVLFKSFKKISDNTSVDPDADAVNLFFTLVLKNVPV